MTAMDSSLEMSRQSEQVWRDKRRHYEPDQNLTSWEGGKRRKHNLNQSKTERAPARAIQGTQQEIINVEIDPRFVYSNQRGRARFVLGKFRDCAACPLPNLFNPSEVSEFELAPSQLGLSK